MCLRREFRNIYSLLSPTRCLGFRGVIGSRGGPGLVLHESSLSGAICSRHLCLVLSTSPRRRQDKGRGCPLLPARRSRSADARPALRAPRPGPEGEGRAGARAWAPGRRGGPRRPRGGAGELGPCRPDCGSILRVVLPGSRCLVAVSLGSAMRRPSRAARGARPASHGVLGVLADGSVCWDTLGPWLS